MFGYSDILIKKIKMFSTLLIQGCKKDRGGTILKVILADILVYTSDMANIQPYKKLKRFLNCLLNLTLNLVQFCLFLND